MSLSKKAETVVQAYGRGYRVNEDGDVISPKGRKRKPQRDTKGSLTYYRFSFKRDGGQHSTVNYHQLAAYQKFGLEAFGIGEDGRRLHVRHLDENPLNNRLWNLALGTAKQNSMDRSPECRVAHAKKAAAKRRKLTMEQARSLRADRGRGMKYDELSAKYGVPKSSVSYIVNGKMYQEA